MGRIRDEKPDKQSDKVIHLPGAASVTAPDIKRGVKLLVDGLEALDLVHDVVDEVERRKWLEGVGLDEKLRLVVRLELTLAGGQMGHSGGEFLTVDQAAHRVEVAPGTIREWIKKNKLKAVKEGRQYRIRRADLDQSLAQQVKKPQRVDIDEEAARLVSMDRSKRRR